jgi:hypothetical protein
MHKSTYIPVLTALVVLGGCPLGPMNGDSPDQTEDSTADTALATDAGTSPALTTTDPDSDDSDTTGPDAPDTTDADTGFVDTTAPDTMDTADTADTTTSDSDTTTTTTDSDGEASATDTTDDTGDPVCVPEDPTVTAGFKVELDDWPGQADDNHVIEVECTIDAVNSDGVTVTTTLTCDFEGQPRGASFAIDASSAGPVDWSAGQAVTLESNHFDDFVAIIRSLRVTLLADPAVLLVFVEDDGDANTTRTIGPIFRERVNDCPLEFGDSLYENNYSLMSGANVTISSGNRDVLPIDATHGYAIDVEFAGEDCCHSYDLSLIRRVKTG